MKSNETGADQAVEWQPNAEEILSWLTGLQGDALEALISNDVVQDNLAERLPRQKPSEEMIQVDKIQKRIDRARGELQVAMEELQVAIKGVLNNLEELVALVGSTPEDFGENSPQNLIAKHLLYQAASLLPQSERMQRAAETGLRQSGMPSIDDFDALVLMSCRIIASGGTKKPKTAAREIACQLGGDLDSTTRRLLRKYQEGHWRIDRIAAQRVYQTLVMAIARRAIEKEGERPGRRSLRKAFRQANARMDHLGWPWQKGIPKPG